MMHLLRKYDVAPLRVAMMRCLPLCARRHTSLGVAVIIGAANIIFRRQTSLKKDTRESYVGDLNYAPSRARNPSGFQALCAPSCAKAQGSREQPSRGSLVQAQIRSCLVICACGAEFNHSGYVKRKIRCTPMGTPYFWRRWRDLNSRAGIADLHP